MSKWEPDDVAWLVLICLIVGGPIVVAIILAVGQASR